MNNFEKFGSIDVAPINTQLKKYPDFWNAHRFRQTFYGSPHAQVSDIWMRFPSMNNLNLLVWYHASAALWEARDAAVLLGERFDAKSVDRVLITSLPAGGKILPHSEADDPYFTERGRKRFHIVLNGEPGSTFHCGDESVDMLTGEIWSFDALKIHSVDNNSDADRVHLIVDLLLKAP